MRLPKYISPSSLAIYEKDKREFYLKYLADDRPPRFPQTQPMSIGASFDAHVKSYLMSNLKGRAGDPRFELRTIFEAQVEAHNRDFAWNVGAYVFKCYLASGALADLMLELEQAMEEPKFEFEIESRIPHIDIVSGIPLLGKPDLFYRSRGGLRIVHDWKVNGFMGKGNTSPKKGYIMCRDGWDASVAEASRSHRTAHKDCQQTIVDGLHLNVAHYLEDIDVSWADQLAIYGWVLGEPVGTKSVFCIEQITKSGVAPAAGATSAQILLRVSSYRNRINAAYQEQLYKRLAAMWKHILCSNEGSCGFFADMDRAASNQLCASLNDYYKAYAGQGENDEWFQSITRQH